MNNNIEKRFDEEIFSPISLEVRQEGDKRNISGYVAKFNSLSRNLGGFREIIRFGAFSNTIEKDDIRFLKNHDRNFIYGRNVSGTLTLSEDQTGLYISNDVPNTQWAKDDLESIQRGDINEGSFGFRTILDNWVATESGVIRELIEVKLFDVALVTFAAYPSTGLAARSAARSIGFTDDDFEKLSNIEEFENLEIKQVFGLRSFYGLDLPSEQIGNFVQRASDGKLAVNEIDALKYSLDQFRGEDVEGRKVPDSSTSEGSGKDSGKENDYEVEHLRCNLDLLEIE